MAAPRTTPLAAALAALVALTLACALPLLDRASAGKSKRGPQTTWRFPVRGAHDFGGQQGRFGAKRPDGSIHAGQDVLADCGTPLVAVHRSEVRARGYSPATGHYIVLDGLGTKYDFVYDHMKGPARYKAGKTIKPGARVGSVGSTGSSIGVCHLHFELWTGRWFAGGRRVDPLKKLRSWDKFS